MIRSRAILRHARGQQCQLALPGICSHDPDTTVFAHLNGAAFGKGGGQKAHDIAGFFADHRCHMAYDLANHGLSAGDLNAALLKAVIGTWLILIADGIITVPQDQPKARKVRPRKPREERAKVQTRSRPIQSRGFPKSQRSFKP